MITTVAKPRVLWNVKVVKNRAAYCGVLRRVFECSSERSNERSNVRSNERLHLDLQSRRPCVTEPNVRTAQTSLHALESEWARTFTRMRLFDRSIERSFERLFDRSIECSSERSFERSLERSFQRSNTRRDTPQYAARFLTTLAFHRVHVVILGCTIPAV